MSASEVLPGSSARNLRLAIGAIFKNEAPYVLEWVAFHRAVGIDHFFVADNGSDDGTTAILADLAQAGVVTHIPFPGTPGQAPQLPAYAEIMRRHGGDADFIAFIDADEFLLPTDGETSIRPVISDLAQTPDLGAIAINWACFGSSGHEKQSEDLVIRRFSKRADQDLIQNHHYKSIVRTTAWLRNHGTPHMFVLKPTFRLFRTDGQPVQDHVARGAGLSQEVCWDRIRLNHYVVKSRQEFFERKGPRGRASVVGGTKGEGYFSTHDRNDVTDPMPQRFLDATALERAALLRLVSETKLAFPGSVLHRRNARPARTPRIYHANGIDTVYPNNVVGHDALSELKSLNSVLSVRNTYKIFSASESFDCRKIEIISEGPKPLSPTQPVFLPLSGDGVFPRRTIARPVILSHLEDAVCYPGGLIYWNDRIFSESFRNGIERGNTNLGEDVIDRMEEISSSAVCDLDGPAFYLDGEHFSAFGHFFGEIYSRLWISDYVRLGDLKIIVGKGHDQPFIKELLSFAGIKPHQLFQLDRPVKCRSLYVASQSHVVRTGLSAIGQKFYDGIADRHAEGIDVQRVYISRRLKKSRSLNNERDVENIFRRNGFSTFFPELLSMQAQLALFRNSIHMAGQSGSNLFSCLVSKNTERMLILTDDKYLLHNDSVINTFHNRKITYYIGKSRKSAVFSDWDVNFEIFKNSLRTWLDTL